MTVTKIADFKSKETVEMLRDLLEKAENGEILGLVFCVRLGIRRHAMGVSGHYKDDPVMAVAVTARMGHRLNVAADALDEVAEPIFRNG